MNTLKTKNLRLESEIDQYRDRLAGAEARHSAFIAKMELERPHANAEKQDQKCSCGRASRGSHSLSTDNKKMRQSSMTTFLH